MSTTYGHHETCGICHTSGPCKHTIEQFTESFKRFKEAPRDTTVKISIPREILNISNAVIPDTITWYRQLDEITQEVVNGLADEIRGKVLRKLQSLCKDHDDHQIGTSPSGLLFMECKKCTRAEWKTPIQSHTSPQSAAPSASGQGGSEYASPTP
jgi:hypothetical protein